jgi:hypothetical protein
MIFWALPELRLQILALTKTLYLIEMNRALQILIQQVIFNGEQQLFPLKNKI